MTQKISEKVSVSFTYNHQTCEVFPKWISWRGRLYPVVKVGLHHTYREGRTLFHVFSVISKTVFLRLILNTDNLHWDLEEVSDIN
ncbi:hypothetical protein KW795_02810 [Candidatus Microgenomates bacterium]|nr:hypothetical protein [Candidatus Microgenomates bacterium]